MQFTPMIFPLKSRVRSVETGMLGNVDCMFRTVSGNQYRVIFPTGWDLVLESKLEAAPASTLVRRVRPR
jgi:hypothetical protein